MWCRFLTFCILVTLVLFVVLSCIYRRPVIHMFFHRCCGEDIENDQVIFENFGNNFLRERLVGAEIVEVDNITLSDDEVNFNTFVSNVHDPVSRVKYLENEDNLIKDVTDAKEVDDIESNKTELVNFKTITS